jgi:hypothetical protein
METLANIDPAEDQTTSLAIWTGSKAGLIELAYALKAAGIIGEGRTTLQVIVE